MRILNKLLLLLILLANTVVAQQIKWGEKQDLSSYDLTALGQNDSIVFLSAVKEATIFSDKQMLLQKVSLKTLKTLATIPVDVSQLKQNKLEKQELTFITGTPYLLCSGYDNTSGQFLVNLFPFTENRIAHIPALKLSFKGKPASAERTLRFQKYSSDSSRLMLMHNASIQKSLNESVEIAVIRTSNLSVEWQKIVELPHKSFDLGMKDAAVDSTGNAYILTKTGEQKESLFSSKGPARYYLYKVNEKGLAPEFDLTLEGKEIISGVLATKNDQLFAAGLYSKGRSNSITGAFYLRINGTTGEIENAQSQDLDVNFMLKFLNSGHTEKDLANFYIDHFKILNDNTAVLTAEQYYEYPICYTDPRTGMMRCTYYYYYNDILAIKFNQEGKFDWARRIPKSQVSVNERGAYSSYNFLLGANNEIYFLYNDNPKNLKQPGSNKAVSNFKKSLPVIVSINQQGEQKKSPFAHDLKDLFLFKPKNSLELDDDKLLLFAQKGKYFRVGRLEL